MQRVLGLFLLALVATFLLPGASAASGSCTSAQVEESFSLPDGSVHPAGRLTLCAGGPSPVFALQRTFVDGKPVGMFASRRQVVAHTGNDAYYLIFHRVEGRPLRLSGYGQPAGGQTELFTLDGTARVEVEDSIARGPS